jgi:hypothetical protein
VTKLNIGSVAKLKSKTDQDEPALGPPLGLDVHYSPEVGLVDALAPPALCGLWK